MGKNLFNDITSDIDLPTERELNEDTRRAKISATHISNWKHDPAYKKLKQEAALKTAEKRRKVPVEEYEKLIIEYWQRDEPRPLNFSATIATRYGVKHVDTIVNNHKGTMDSEQYQQLVDAYNKKFPNAKQDLASSQRDHANAGKNISRAKQTLTDEEAIEVYEACKPWWKQHGAVAFKKKLAKKYGVSLFKIKITASGQHPALNGSRNDVKVDK
tara:strand:+ start:1003 stop:1647 length:645 start_codon:yes stop_codon:yes gene_type:complete